MLERPTRRVIVLMAALFAQACSSSPEPIAPGGDASSPEDVSNSEPVVVDRGAEAPRVEDAGPDNSVDTGPGPCAPGSGDKCPTDQYCDPASLSCKPGCKSHAACLTGACSPEHACVECVPGADDKCPAGKYCTAQYACVPGCKNDAACASGKCEATHDCTKCLSDLECGGGRVCSTGRCLDKCGTTPNCPMDSTCCGDRCADLNRDPLHCGDCNTACSSAQFCSPGGCKSAILSNVCASPAATFLLDGLSTDDAATATLEAGLASNCQPSPKTVVVAQKDSGLINPTTGKPVGGGANMVVIAGGPFGQLLLKYLESTRATPIYSYYDASVNQLRARATTDGGMDDGGSDTLVVNAPQSTITDSHSFFVVELMLDPPSGTLMLAIYGVSASGTQAGAWYFVQKMVPARATLDKSWYVYEWTDQDANQMPGDADTFRLVATSS
jgi:hypothetical protein